MKNLNDVIAAHPEKRALIRAVINHISISTVPDVTEFGPDAGFSGFIFAQDTTKFYRRHRAIINAWLFTIAESLNRDPVNLVQIYTELWGGGNDYSQTAIPACILNHKLPDTPFTPVEHSLSLFALEQVCKLFTE